MSRFKYSHTDQSEAKQSEAKQLEAKPAKTLKRYVLKIQSLSAITVVLSYSLLVSFYFIRGLNEANFQDLHLESNHFASQYNAALKGEAVIEPNNNAVINKLIVNKQAITLPHNIHYQGYLSWTLVPEIFQINFPQLAFVNQFTMDSARTFNGITSFIFPEKALFIVAQPLDDGRVFYLTREIDIEKYDQLSQSGIIKMMMPTLPIALAFLLIMHILVKFVLKKTLKLVESLGLWVDGLTIDNVNDEKPHFEFIELERIAKRQQEALIRMSEMIDKEQDFLRHASHELRTPIAVVKSNSELIPRILAKQASDNPMDTFQAPDNKALIAIDRIHRAALNMQHTTETLLWLSREENSILPAATINLCDIVKQLIDDNRYLLQGKKVEVLTHFTQIKDAGVNLAVTPCRLALNNIIRNAFQYTDAGIVEIKCEHTKVLINNSCVLNQGSNTLGAQGISSVFSQNNASAHANANSDYGYGLGLRLVDKIVLKMQWSYQIEMCEGGRKVVLNFK